MGYTFWQGIKSLRSVAYFKEAMDSGGTESLQQKWKDNPRFRDRLLLSGVICASTVALFSRSLYRRIKRHNEARRKEKAREQKALNNSFNDNYSLVEPNKEDQLPQKQPIITPPIKKDNGDVIIQPENKDFDTQDYYQKPVEIDDIDAMFESDALPTQKMYNMSGKIQHMRFITTKIDRPNCVLVIDNDDDHRYYINGSGIFDKNHNAYYIAGQNETLALSRLIQNKSKAIIGDLFTIFESYYEDY